MSDHYFSASPQSNLREIDVELALGGLVHRFIAPSGIFSPGGVDRGTKVLLETVPSPTGRTVVDLGCGWGPLALTMAFLNPEATVWAVDVNERAREAMKKNAERLGVGSIQTVSPDQFPIDQEIDTLWSNPPIRIGKQALRTLLETWLNRLTPSGEAWLVVAKQLGADSLQRWLNDGSAGAFQCERVATSKGFRVLRVTRA